ncbi:EamA family transporter RarD [Luteimonas aquatica]|uniref:EamA family transporter RarD n=1 Tax=Luteimonas aquatica TaxID=450364 RepID=UPI001F587A9B|nr:EamA family transporter RarD [Luteimonas aquatica]
MSPAASLDRRGLWTAAASFVLWGLMPLYWHALKAVPSLQIVLHRVVWSTLLVAGWLCWKQGAQWWRPLLSRPRVALLLLLSGSLIAFNWSLYIWAVNAGHVVETSLGYFINPLLNVVLGVLLLRERLTPAQWLAAAVATIGVLWLTFNYGSFPWIALALAASFGLYGLVRKVVAVDSIPGLGVESLYLFLPAIALLVWSEATGSGQFFAGGWGTGMDVLLVLAGALTALPLIGFAYAVRRIPYSIVGLMQYIAPTLQFLIGVFVLHEAFDRDRLIGFVFIWVGLAIFAGEGWWRSRRRIVAEPA